MHTKRLLIGLVSGLLAGQACGQLAPPPPKEPTREKVPFVPPPPRAQPVQAQAPRPSTPRPPATPAIPYVSLVERDAEGFPIPIQGQITMAALKHNPLVGAETVKKAGPVTTTWIDNLDLLVIDNIDMVLEVDAGFFETLDMMSEQGVMDAQAYRSALFPKPSLLDSYLFSEGVITDAQRKFTGKLISEYVQQMTISIGDRVEKEWRERITAENGGEPREFTAEESFDMRKEFSSKGFAFTFWYLCSDSVWSMHRQLAFAAEHLAEILPELDLSEDELGLYKRTMVAMRQTDDVLERRQLMVELITPWEFENQEALMLTALDLRGPLESIAELESAATKPDGSEPREDLKDWMPGQAIAPPPGGDG
jgi:hypothetical protein